MKFRRCARNCEFPRLGGNEPDTCPGLSSVLVAGVSDGAWGSRILGPVSNRDDVMEMETITPMDMNSADLGLPETFPARIGLGLLSRYTLILDHKNQRVWIEGKPLPRLEESDPSIEEETTAPVQYRGITR